MPSPRQRLSQYGLIQGLELRPVGGQRTKAGFGVGRAPDFLDDLKACLYNMLLTVELKDCMYLFSSMRGPAKLSPS